MPGTPNDRLYTAVPIYHTVQEVRKALSDELVDSKLDAIDKNVALKQQTLHEERNQLFVDGATKKHYTKVKRKALLNY
jgi:hypothetical protein